ncbi:MAG: hypothetical protein J6U53_02890 [Tidjanibacter sp.]|nr:hypothetical protein [Tidjanibacter sp.]
MAEYILQILRSQLMVVFSWGFHCPTALPDDRGLSFLVDGFKYKGEVQVIYNEGVDLFEVVLTNTGDRVEDVYLDCLVNVIDGMVERCADYQSRVEAEYGFAKRI